MDGGQEAGGGGQGVLAGDGAQREDEGDAADQLLQPARRFLPGGGDGEPLDEGGLAGARDSAQQDALVAGEGPVGGEGGERGAAFEAEGAFVVLGDGLQAEVRGVQRPGGLGVAEVDADDGQRAVFLTM